MASPSHIVNLPSPCQVKLADFGHSKVVDDIFVRASSHVGTPLYMAPEAFTLEVARLGDGGGGDGDGGGGMGWVWMV